MPASSYNTVCKFALAALALLAGTAPSHAIVYLNNLNAFSVGGFAPGGAGAFMGPSFTTDSSASAFVLNSITVNLSGVVIGPYFEFRLYADNAGLPGTLLATGVGETSPSVSNNYVYTFSSVVLQPATTYWITEGIVSPGIGMVAWLTAASPADLGSWTTSSNSVALTTSNGSAWVRDSSRPLYVTFAVDATPLAGSTPPIPEPATSALLFGLPILALALALRSRHAGAGLAGADVVASSA